MARGLLAGVVAGTVVSGLGLGALSVLDSQSSGPAPEAAAVEVPAGSGFDQPKDDLPPEAPEATAPAQTGDSPQVSAPTPDDVAALDGGATQPAAQPETGAAQEGLAQPADTDNAGGVSVQTESPVLPSPQSVAPATPDGDAGLSISNEPAQPVAPASGEASAFEVEGDTEAAPGGAFPADDLSEIAGGGVTDTPVATPDPKGDPAPEALPDSQPEPEAAAEISEPVQTGEGTIGDLAPDVETARLPSVGDAAPEASTPEAATSEAAATTPEAATEDTRPPLLRFAAGFEATGSAPLMSIILIDDGSAETGIEALADFPFPVSVALDSAWEGAPEAMARYRAQGIEVLAMVDLPKGAGARDVEETLQTRMDQLPEVVAVMDGTGTGLQASRAATEQLVPILRASGHGAVMFKNGLGTAQKLLARGDVPAASVFRDFDSKGQNAAAMRRFLDQAAMKAGREPGGVVMLGRLRPETISTLALWGQQDRSARVTLAPVSAILQRD